MTTTPANAWFGAIGRFLRVVALLTFCALLPARPASAHSAANTPASNYVSNISSIAPQATTFTVQVIEAGSRLELRWRSGDVVVVPDYDGYPYLRIGSKGVEENQQSNAVYLNRSRLGSTTIPDGLKPDGPPEWKRISTEPVRPRGGVGDDMPPTRLTPGVGSARSKGGAA